MENTKYQYKTLKVTTEQEYKKAEKLILSGWVALNVLCNGEVIQFCKASKK
jgi:predicted NodU family carbamoyl transferase